MIIDITNLAEHRKAHILRTIEIDAEQKAHRASVDKKRNAHTVSGEEFVELYNSLISIKNEKNLSYLMIGKFLGVSAARAREMIIFIERCAYDRDYSGDIVVATLRKNIVLSTVRYKTFIRMKNLLKDLKSI